MSDVLFVLKAGVLAHELGHQLANVTCAELVDQPDAVLVITKDPDRNQFVAAYPGDWRPTSAVDRLLTSACGPVTGWAYGESIPGVSRTCGVEGVLDVIKNADAIDILVRATKDQHASPSDLRSMIMLGALAASKEHSRAIRKMLVCCLRLGMWLSATEQGRSFSVPSFFGGLTEHGRFEITVRGLLDLLTAAEEHCASLESEATT